MIKRKEIAAYLAIEERRLALQREVAALGKQAEQYEEHFMEEIREHGGATKTLRTCGHILAIKTAKNSVQWKPEFIRVTSLAAAEKLIAAAGLKEVFSLEPEKPDLAPAASALPAPPGSPPE